MFGVFLKEHWLLCGDSGYWEVLGAPNTLLISVTFPELHT